MNDSMNKKNEARILHLYYDLMNLYGDWANVAALVRALNTRGAGSAVGYKSVGDEVNFDEYDFVYIGSGTERSQRACMRDMERHRQALTGRINAGMHVLATGNSHELFGFAVTEPGGEKYDALGLLDFETVQLDSRVTGDCVCKVPERLKLAESVPDRLIGFINRAGGGQSGSVERPFVTELGPGACEKTVANDAPEGKEGITYKNLLGTYMTGPVLVRNPPLLKYFTDMLCAEPCGDYDGDDPFFGYQEKAYWMALTELSARIGKRAAT